jgi:hypothetical protein
MADNGGWASRLLRSVGLDRAAAWEDGPRLGSVPDPAAVCDLLTIEEIDRLVSSSGLRCPQLRIVRDGNEVDSGSYTYTRRFGAEAVGGYIDGEAVAAQLRQGAVLILQAVQDASPGLAELCADLGDALGQVVRVNAYLAPRSAGGLGLHHDDHDVLVLQVAGQRTWEVYERFGPRPASGDPEPWIANRDAYERLVLSAAPRCSPGLCAGDVLYVPAGHPHRASTSDATSLHLTFSIHRWTRADMILRAVVQLARKSRFRGALPPLSHESEAAEAVREAVAELTEELARVDPLAMLRALPRDAGPMAGSGSGLIVDALSDEHTDNA